MQKGNAHYMKLLHECFLGLKLVYMLTSDDLQTLLSNTFDDHCL